MDLLEKFRRAVRVDRFALNHKILQDSKTLMHQMRCVEVVDHLLRAAVDNEGNLTSFGLELAVLVLEEDVHRSVLEEICLIPNSTPNSETYNIMLARASELANMDVEDITVDQSNELTVMLKLLNITLDDYRLSSRSR